MWKVFSTYGEYAKIILSYSKRQKKLSRPKREKKLDIKGRDQWELIGLWKVAIDRHLVRIVVIDVHFYFNLAAILE